MKRFYGIMMAAVAAMPLAAAVITPEQALERVDRATTRAAEAPQLIETIRDAAGQPAIYIYTYSSDEGFMLLAADDATAPLLGYSRENSFSLSGAPASITSFIDGYKSQISEARELGAAKWKAPATRADEMAKIEPLVKTRWDQGTPFNNLCPIVEGRRSVTGCVATAMAQVMNYWKYPLQGQGSITYRPEKLERDLTMDFSEVTFDWENMADIYKTGSYSNPQANAVAWLMRACGYSVKMNYTGWESGAYSYEIANAMQTYFGYDKGISRKERSNYSTKSWKELIYEQLQNYGPVIYTGVSSGGGHCFVCDGYDGEGLFHINWGWGGMSDGYFLLSALNPLDQGIGGSASDSGFNYDQSILINMKPAVADSKVTPLIYCYGNLESESTNVNLGDDLSVKSSDGFFNFACTDIEGYFGLKLVSSNGTVTYVKRDGKLGLGSISGYAGYSVKLPSDLADGTYTATPAFLPDGESEWADILCPLSGVTSLTLTVSDGVATVASNSSNQPEVSNFTLNTPLYIGDDFSVSFTMTNTGETEYFGEYLLYLFDEDGTEVGPSADINTIDLQPGESVDITYVTKFPSSYSTSEGTVTVEPGEYILGLFTHFTNQQIYIYNTPVSLSEAPTTTTLQVNSFTVNNGKPVVNTDAVEFEGTVECTEGYYAGKITVAVFKDGTNETNMTGKSGEVFIPEGSSADFTAKVDITSAVDGEGFFAIVYAGSKEISNAYHFKVAADGVATIDEAEGIVITSYGDCIEVASEQPLANVTVYTVGGMAVVQSAGNGSREATLSTSGFQRGDYIIVAKDVNGQVKTLHIMR